MTHRLSARDRWLGKACTANVLICPSDWFRSVATAGNRRLAHRADRLTPSGCPARTAWLNISHWNTLANELSRLAIVTVMTIDNRIGANAKRLPTRSFIHVKKSMPCQKRMAQRG